MDSTTQPNRKPLLVRISERLLKDQEELDDMAVQLSLGKAEARDQFEAAKVKLRQSIHEFRVELLENYHEGKGAVKEKLQQLEEQLKETKEGTKEMFEQQKQNILKALDEVKHEIQTDPDLLKIAGFFTTAGEKTRLQIELLEKNWEETKSEWMKGFQENMKTAKFKIQNMVQAAKDKKDEAGEKLEDFNTEIHEAYEHLKKAVRSL